MGSCRLDSYAISVSFFFQYSRGSSHCQILIATVARGLCGRNPRGSTIKFDLAEEESLTNQLQSPLHRFPTNAEKKKTSFERHTG